MLPEHILKRQAEQAQEDAAGRRAASTPLPGPLGEAFAHRQSIKVGGYEVRPFCDADFEALQALDNPIQLMIAKSFEGGAIDEAEVDSIIRKLSRGQHAWNLCYVLTTEPQELDDAMATVGADAVKGIARKKFRALPTVEVVQIVMACIDQFNKSWETMVGLGAAIKEDDKGVASPSSPP